MDVMFHMTTVSLKLVKSTDLLAFLVWS
jgi:hypothetical protein